jgi:DNA-binding transcriptional LysR family regulator
MNIDLELYRIFYAVATAKNITKAAMDLHISQPAVTQSIKRLEGELGGSLFVRTKRGVILTEEGNEFYTNIKQALTSIENAENKFLELKHLDIGTIRIGISTTLTKEFLLPYLEVFHDLYPKIKISIETYVTRELISMLKNGCLDMVVSTTSSNGDKELHLIPCKDIQDIFIIGNKYKHLLDKTFDLKDLCEYPLILQSDLSNTRSFLNKIADKNDIILKPAMTLASHTLVVEFTKIGFGIGYATKEYIKKDLDNKALYELKVNIPIPKRKISIAIKNTSLPTFATKKFISLMTNKKA